MKFKKILMLGYAGGDLDQEHWNRIDKMCEERTMLERKLLPDKHPSLPQDSPEIRRHLAMCDCLLLKLGMYADKGTIDSAPALKYIGMFGTGVGNIDVNYAIKKGVTVCNLYYATEAVAELAFGVILEHLRDLERAKAQIRKGDYSESTFFQTSEIRGKIFGVIGLGRIGGRIAEIAKNGFNADVRYWSKTRKKKFEAKGIRYQQVDKLLKECDFLSLNLAHVKGATNNFLNADRIALLKPGAIIVNLSPNELVDLDALANRLKNNDLTYVLDHSDELPKDQLIRLSSYKNCIIYPPIGYTTKEATLLKKTVFVENLENFLNGKPTNTVKVG